MFTVIEKITGMAVTVYAVNGHYFLIYDEQMGRWGYVSMDSYKPATEKDLWGEF